MLLAGWLFVITSSVPFYLCWSFLRKGVAQLPVPRYGFEFRYTRDNEPVGFYLVVGENLAVGLLLFFIGLRAILRAGG